MIGLVLAGGLSSRFGCDKALVTLPGQKQALLPQLLSLLTAVPGVSGTAVSCRKEQVPLLKTLVSTRFVIDKLSSPPTDPTPLRGILSALEKFNDALFVLPCDLPYMTTEILTLLADARTRKATSETLRTVFFHEDGTLEPLVAIYEKEALPFLRQALREHRWGLHSVIPSHRQILVSCSNHLTFFNMNTPADLSEVHRLQLSPAENILLLRKMASKH